MTNQQIRRYYKSYLRLAALTLMARLINAHAYNMGMAVGYGYVLGKRLSRVYYDLDCEIKKIESGDGRE